MPSQCTGAERRRLLLRACPRPDFRRSMRSLLGRVEVARRVRLSAVRLPGGVRAELPTGLQVQEMQLPGFCHGGHGAAWHAAAPARLVFGRLLVATHTPGISAVQLQRQLGLKRYETAWGLLQKLRRAMVRPERDRISGEVEVDETYIGGLEEGRGAGRLRDSSHRGQIIDDAEPDSTRAATANRQRPRRRSTLKNRWYPAALCIPTAGAVTAPSRTRGTTTGARHRGQFEASRNSGPPDSKIGTM